MYTMESKIRFSECDSSGVLAIPGIINYFQDCSSMQSEINGVGIDYLGQKKRAWILSSWQIIVERRPKMAEEVTVSTWATGFNGFMGTRNYIMKTKNGEVLAYANSLWVYMNMENGRPARPETSEIEAYQVETPLEMEYADRKIKLLQETVPVDTFSVRKYHIDTNQHMNNCQYVRLALEAVPELECVSQIRTEYKKAAVYGDTIIAKVATAEDRTVVMLCDAEDHLYAAVELIGEKKR